VILLLPPVHPIPQLVIDDVLKRNGYTIAKEIEPIAGCRRFRLS
jgi:hypothetical protein